MPEYGAGTRPRGWPHLEMNLWHKWRAKCQQRGQSRPFQPLFTFGDMCHVPKPEWQWDRQSHRLPLSSDQDRAGRQRETHWHVSFPAQTFRRSWGQRADRSPFILSLLLLRVCASLAAWHPGGHRENAQQEKLWSPQVAPCSPRTSSHAGSMVGDTHPLSPGNPGVLVPCTRPPHHKHTVKHSPQQSPWSLTHCPLL